ncbi:MAG: ATP-dependent RNA helicase [Myxococcales bacterium]|nr:ATP-dependent RNA helicase [Myxococcales bacterium]
MEPPARRGGVALVAERLPIEVLKDDLRAALSRGPVVISAPTGSGKSTQVPRWCPQPVLVVEPRRVACRTLAARVASLEGCPLGGKVGYHVRDDVQAGPDTRILFVTPGIALLQFQQLEKYQTIILDEFHERSLDLDLLYALLARRPTGLVVMSATLEADRIAAALGGEHLEAQGRAFEVTVRHEADGPAFPSPRHLTDRVVRAVERMADVQGDLLVFLPGKGEIGKARAALGNRPGREVVELHGGLTPKEQARAFEQSAHQKIILSTNVAETSVTVPGVRGVIDSGLVRQTRYHQGRGALTLAAIADDSAEQRRGRAGRVAPGVCLRLWQASAELKARTLPEVYRESLVPLVLAAKACGADVRALPFLDALKDHAVEAAEAELAALGALGAAGVLTERGRRLFHLPLDPWLGRLLVEAEHQGQLEDAVDLVAALAVDRPLFSEPSGVLDDDDPRSPGCDAVALVRAVRAGADAAHPAVLKEARAYRTRLRVALGLPDRAPDPRAAVDGRRIARLVLAADPRSAYLARHRKKHVAWANGGTELELDKRSALQLVTRDGHTHLPVAMAVLGLRVFTDGPSTRLSATYATPLTLQELNAAGLGEPKLGPVKWRRGRVEAEVEYALAGRTLRTDTLAPRGAQLREALTRLIAQGSAFKGVRGEASTRLAAGQLLVRMVEAGLMDAYDEELAPLRGLPTELERWLEARLAQLGLEDPEDVELVDEQDLLPPALPDYLAERLGREYPATVELGDASYRAEYQPLRRKVILHLVRGQRRSPPPRQYLPRFPGLTIHIQAGGTFHQL